MRDGGAQARFEFKQELCFSFTVHERFWCGGWKRKKPQPVKVGWGFLNEVGGLTRKGDRQASKPWEREKVSRVVGQRDNAVRPPGNAGSERCERGCFRHGYITRMWRALRRGSQGPWRRSNGCRDLTAFSAKSLQSGRNRRESARSWPAQSRSVTARRSETVQPALGVFRGRIRNTAP